VHLAAISLRTSLFLSTYSGGADRYGENIIACRSKINLNLLVFIQDNMWDLIELLTKSTEEEANAGWNLAAMLGSMMARFRKRKANLTQFEQQILTGMDHLSIG
jgi:hypothetical protein